MENRRGNGAAYPPAQEPSLPAALEKLTAATQGVITKRIDLVMLEIHELVGTLVMKTGLIVFGVIVALAAWFGAISALVLWLTPNMGTVGHLAIFSLVNLAIGAVVVFFALRAKLPTLGAEAEDDHEHPEEQRVTHTH
ncbi:MAG TPA: phage holin family protein [Candidatus Binatia bacterium]|nr:phage holin family protein [Candidatus Binatia bacterium]